MCENEQALKSVSSFSMPPGEPSKRKAMKRKIEKPNTIIENTSISAEIVASLDDILTQILLKVPIKPLFRSKLVSKHWLSLISSRDFCLRRNPTPNPPQGVFLCIRIHHVYQYKYFPLIPNSSEPFLPSINLNFTTAPLSTKILQSCNGLLLCQNSLKWIEIDPDLSQRSLALLQLTRTDSKLYVYNPTTNFSALIPDLPFDMTRFTIFLISTTLVFDPVKSPHYKVVCVAIINYEVCEILIYSSETGTWIPSCEIELGMSVDIPRNGVYWNGSIHWLNCIISTNDPTNSIRFHVDTQKLGEMPSPPVAVATIHKSNVYFGESFNHLHFIKCILPKFDVYEMKEDYSEWFVKYKVDISAFVAAYPEVIVTSYYDRIIDVTYVLSLFRGKNEEDSKLFLRVWHKALKINLVDGTWEKLCDLVHHYYDKEYYKSHGFDYIQSLHSRNCALGF